MVSSSSSRIAKGSPPSFPLARVRPTNLYAHAALRDVENDLNDYHREFVKFEHNAASRNNFRSQFETAYFEDHHVYYVRDLQTATTEGWMMRVSSPKWGVNRGVQLRVGCSEQNREADIQPNHALIRFHEKSEVLMLVA